MSLKSVSFICLSFIFLSSAIFWSKSCKYTKSILTNENTFTYNYNGAHFLYYKNITCFFFFFYHQFSEINLYFIRIWTEILWLQQQQSFETFREILWDDCRWDQAESESEQIKKIFHKILRKRDIFMFYISQPQCGQQRSDVKGTPSGRYCFVLHKNQ